MWLRRPWSEKRGAWGRAGVWSHAGPGTPPATLDLQRCGQKRGRVDRGTAWPPDSCEDTFPIKGVCSSQQMGPHWCRTQKAQSSSVTSRGAWVPILDVTLSHATYNQSEALGGSIYSCAPWAQSPPLGLNVWCREHCPAHSSRSELGSGAFDVPVVYFQGARTAVTRAQEEESLPTPVLGPLCAAVCTGCELGAAGMSWGSSAPT